jgi:outer membrane lipoprotein carrier protein
MFSIDVAMRISQAGPFFGSGQGVRNEINWSCNMRKSAKMSSLFCAVALFAALVVFETPVSLFAAPPLAMEEIIERVEQRYAVAGFSARFVQTSTLKAMAITETAAGRLFAKPPGMMRWEYETPERQLVITDGRKLWIYRPDDFQVMVGRAPSFFGEGKGAGFLSNIKGVQENFEITPGGPSKDTNYVLKLIPKKKTFDISKILLFIASDTFDVVQVVTYNPYDDETRIELNDYEHKKNLTDSLFIFDIPKGVDVVKMDE